MKLRKSDLQELKKSPKTALLAKLKEAKIELSQLGIKKFKNENLTNIREGKTTRRAIAQLNTLIGSMKE